MWVLQSERLHQFQVVSKHDTLDTPNFPHLTEDLPIKTGVPHFAHRTCCSVWPYPDIQSQWYPVPVVKLQSTRHCIGFTAFESRKRNLKLSSQALCWIANSILCQIKSLLKLKCMPLCLTIKLLCIGWTIIQVYLEFFWPC